MQANLKNLVALFVLNAQHEGNAGIDHRLAMHRVAEEFVGDVDVGKDLKVGAPAHHVAE